MAKLKTLNELDHLRQSRFGRPRPRHGLRLLYWFATECVSIPNSDMVSLCDPESGDYGFHLFENRYQQNGVKLLPDVDFEYYVVGNLNRPGAEHLPDYVCLYYTGLVDNSNMDRIIVSLDEDLNGQVVFDRVYVTEHSDRSNYNPGTTYRISKGLLRRIGSLELNHFLQLAEHWVGTIPVPVPPEDRPVRRNPEQPALPPAGPSNNHDVTVEIEPPPAPDVSLESHGVRSSKRSRDCPCTIL